MEYPLEIWDIILYNMDTKSINNLMITLGHLKINIKDIIRYHIINRLRKYNAIINIFNNLDNINTRKEYIKSFNSLFLMKSIFYDSQIILALYKHLVKYIQDEQIKKKFYNLVRPDKLDFNTCLNTDKYIIQFLKCI